MKTLVSGNAEQTQRLNELESLVNERMDFLAKRIELRKNNSIEEIQKQFADDRGRKLSDAIRFSINQMKDKESEILTMREAELDRNLTKTYQMLYLAGFAGILSLATKRWFILQVSALKGDGNGAVISHINITDRKLAEQELKNSEQFSRSIFENSPDCVKILELDGTLHLIEQQWSVHYGD